MPARLEIDAEALRENIAAVRERIAPAELVLVTKDEAYGHGLDWAVPAALEAGVHWIGSYDIGSALRIRAMSPEVRIFAWETSSAPLVADAIAADIDLGVGTIEYLRRVIDESRKAEAVARVHLKIDTGLHRNGIRPEHWADAVAVARAAEDAGLLRVVGVWSHLAEASDDEDDDAQREFHAAVEALQAAGGTPEHLHLTASAASWWRPELRGTMCRIGAFCYGIRSADGPELDGLRRVSALKADVIDTAADRVRLDIGALDGLPSTLAGAAVGDGSVRILRVGPTWTDLEPWEGAVVGQTFTILGPGAVSATDLAEHIDTVGEEILTRISPLIARVEVSPRR